MDLKRAKEIAARLGIVEEVDQMHLVAGRPKRGMHIYVDKLLPDEHSHKAGIVLIGKGLERVQLPDTLCDASVELVCRAYEAMFPTHTGDLIKIIRDIVMEKEPTKRVTRLSKGIERIESMIGKDEHKWE